MPYCIYMLIKWMNDWSYQSTRVACQPTRSSHYIIDRLIQNQLVTLCMHKFSICLRCVGDTFWVSAVNESFCFKFNFPADWKRSCSPFTYNVVFDIKLDEVLIVKNTNINQRSYSKSNLLTRTFSSKYRKKWRIHSESIMFHLKKSAKSVSDSKTEVLISKHDELEKDCAKLILDNTRWEASQMQWCLDDIALQSFCKSGINSRNHRN